MKLFWHIRDLLGLVPKVKTDKTEQHYYALPIKEDLYRTKTHEQYTTENTAFYYFSRGIRLRSDIHQWLIDQEINVYMLQVKRSPVAYRVNIGSFYYNGACIEEHFDQSVMAYDEIHSLQVSIVFNNPSDAMAFRMRWL